MLAAIGEQQCASITIPKCKHRLRVQNQSNLDSARHNESVTNPMQPIKHQTLSVQFRQPAIIWMINGSWRVMWSNKVSYPGCILGFPQCQQRFAGSREER